MVAKERIVIRAAGPQGKQGIQGVPGDLSPAGMAASAAAVSAAAEAAGYVEDAAAAIASGFLTVDTLAELDAIVDRPDGAQGYVVNDGANNGSYRWNDATTEWVRYSTDTLPSVSTRAREAYLRAGAGLAFDIYLSDEEPSLYLDGAGRPAENYPVDFKVYAKDLNERGTFLIYLSDENESFVLDANGRVMSAPMSREVFDAYVDARGTFTIYLSDEVSFLQLDADGREMNFGGSGSVEPEELPVYYWLEGSDYENLQSYFMYDPTKYMILVPAIGQSYNEGAIDETGETSYNSTPRAGLEGLALMLEAGVKPNGASSSGFVNLQTAANRSPYVAEAVNYVVSSMKTRFGTSIPMIAAVANRGGWNYFRLKRGSIIFAEFERIVQEAKDLAAALGKRLIVPAVFFGHGESDSTDHLDWQAHSDIMQWRADCEEVVYRHCPWQTERVKALMYATNRSSPTGTLRASPWQVASRRLTLEQPDLYCLYAPAYAVETFTNNHPTDVGYRQLGAYGGRAYESMVFGTGRRPADVLTAYWLSDTEVQLELYGPDSGVFEADLTNPLVGYPAEGDPNYIGPGGGANGRAWGWWVRDKDGGPGNIGVDQAELTATNRLKLTLSRAGHRGSTRLIYASRATEATTSGNNTNMARGVLRTNVGFNIPGLADPLYDWLVPQQVIL